MRAYVSPSYALSVSIFTVVWLSIVAAEQPVRITGSALTFRVSNLCHVENADIVEGVGTLCNLGDKLSLVAGDAGKPKIVSSEKKDYIYLIVSHLQVKSCWIDGTILRF